MDDDIIRSSEISIKDALSEMVEMAASGRAKNLTAEIEECLVEIEYLKKKGYSLQQIADWLKSKGISKENGEAITAKNLKDTLSKIRAKSKKKEMAQTRDSAKPSRYPSAPASVSESASRPVHTAPTSASKLLSRELRVTEEDEHGTISSRQRKGDEIAKRYSTDPVNPLAQSFLKNQSQERSRD